MRWELRRKNTNRMEPRTTMQARTAMTTTKTVPSELEDEDAVTSSTVVEVVVVIVVVVIVVVKGAINTTRKVSIYVLEF